MASLIYYILLLVLTLIYFVPFSLLFFVTYPFDKERVALHWASRMWSLGIFRLCPLWKVRTSGMDKIESGKPYVIITNHQSMLDIPMMYVLPLNFKWVSKKEVLRWPIFGWVLGMHGDITIARGSSGSAKKMVEQATERLDAGTSVIIFPEGTRSRDGKIGRFKEGAFLMAKSAGVGILPVVSEGTGSLNDGWRLRMPHRFTVEVLDPVPAEEVAAADIKELTADMQRRMTAAHDKIKQQLKEEK